MNNPRKILSIKDIELLESKNIDIPDKELNDSEWDNLIVQIAINLKQEEAEKLAKMKDDERRNYELEQARKKQEEAELKLSAYELKEEAIKMANIPETQVDVSLLNLIDFRSIKAEQVEPTIKNIKKVFDSAVENEVNKRLKETTPKTVNANISSNSERVSRFSV